MLYDIRHQHCQWVQLMNACPIHAAESKLTLSVLAYIYACHYAQQAIELQLGEKESEKVCSRAQEDRAAHVPKFLAQGKES